METEDVAFAREWMRTQEPPVELLKFADGYNFRPLPGYARKAFERYGMDETEAMAYLAEVLAPIRRSLEPAIRQRLEAEIRREINEENDRGLM